MGMVESGDLKNLFGDKPKVIEQEASFFKEMRDEWNEKVKQRSEERNGYNLQVQELISEVQIKKSIRDKANQKVKELKDLRAEHSRILKEKRNALKAVMDEITENKQNNKEKRGRSASRIRVEMEQLEQKFERGRLSMNERAFMKRMKELSQELRDAKKNKSPSGSHHELRSEVKDAAKIQEESHNDVENAVDQAQQAHDIMSRISEEVDKLRDAANESHSGLIRAKREADLMHSKYIVALKCMHSMSDLISAQHAKEEGSLDERSNDQTGVSDIMEQLMSGGTISTDDLMLIQRKG